MFHLIQRMFRNWMNLLKEKKLQDSDAPDPTSSDTVARETHDDTFIRIARQSTNLFEVRRAVSVLQDEMSLLTLARDQSMDYPAHLVVLERIQSPSILLAIVFGPDSKLAAVATKRIVDPDMILMILRYALHADARKHAVAQCNDGDAIYKVANEDDDEDVRWLASERFADILCASYTAIQA